MTDLNTLRELAMKATPGPWFDGDYDWVFSGPHAVCKVDSARTAYDVDYIAAVSPEIVLKLIEVAKAAEYYQAIVYASPELDVAECQAAMTTAQRELKAALSSLTGEG